MKNLDEILKDISGFIKYWEKLSNDDSTGEYHRCYEHLCYYWRAIKDALVLLVEPLALLWNKMWPITRFATSLEDQFSKGGIVCEEYSLDDLFVDQRRDCPVPSFRVLHDLYEGYFAIVWPVDGDN
jgi:hypothetical protein